MYVCLYTDVYYALWSPTQFLKDEIHVGRLYYTNQNVLTYTKSWLQNLGFSPGLQHSYYSLVMYVCVRDEQNHIDRPIKITKHNFKTDKIFFSHDSDILR